MVAERPGTPRRALAWALILPILGGCAGSSSPRVPVEATSFLGAPLRRPDHDAEFRAEQEALLAEAETRLAEAPDDPEAWIWVGRRLAYLGRYRDAITHYTRALERFPDEARLFRHRGHRYITVRELERATADLERAAGLIAGHPDEVEPDGLPNERGIPTSTLATNVHYHLGLARYLAGDWAGARRAYVAGLEASTTADMQVAMNYWLVLTLWRLGEDADPEAQLLLWKTSPGWELIENEDYYALIRAFAGDQDPRDLLPVAREAGGVAFATVGYGVGEWLRHTGARAEARQLFAEIVAAGPWSAFGNIAAEAELAR